MNLLAPKIFDFVAFLESDRMAVFDSDLLFFNEPTAYLKRIEDSTYQLNTFITDAGKAYAVDLDAAVPLIGHDLVARFNGGLGSPTAPRSAQIESRSFLPCGAFSTGFSGASNRLSMRYAVRATVSSCCRMSTRSASRRASTVGPFAIMSAGSGT
jgi:hypothetical protein